MTADSCSAELVGDTVLLKSCSARNLDTVASSSSVLSESVRADLAWHKPLPPPTHPPPADACDACLHYAASGSATDQGPANLAGWLLDKSKSSLAPSSSALSLGGKPNFWAQATQDPSGTGVVPAVRPGPPASGLHQRPPQILRQVVVRAGAEIEPFVNRWHQVCDVVRV